MDKSDFTDLHYQGPETQEDMHRPQGVPRPREIKSQQAQLHSTHQHGTSKDVKVGMSHKIGLGEKKRH